MKVTIKIAFYSLIVYSALWVSATRAVADGIAFNDSSDAEESGRVVLRDPGFNTNAAGYAVPVPFGPSMGLEGVFGQGRGYSNNYYRVNAFIPKHIVPAESLIFTSLNGAATDDGKAVGNFGFGYRQYVRSLDRVFGASGWFDFDDGHNDLYTQAGLNVESMGRYLDFNFNGFMIVGRDSNTIFQTILGPSFFRGNSVLQNFVTATENAYSGFDVELGGPLPYIGRYGISAYAGGYYLNSREDEETAGVRVRVQGRLSDDATVGMEYTSDGVFGDNAYVNVALSFPPGKRHRWFRQRPVRERLADQVVRNNRIATNIRAEKRVIFAVNPSDNQPYVAVHVDPNAGAAGTGTFENPFNTLEAARLANAANIDFIRVIPRGDGTNTNLAMNGPFVLLGSQRLLATSSTHLFSTQAGVFELPGSTGSGPGPLISNNALVASDVVQLTGTNEVSGFIIDGRDALANPIHTGIRGLNTNGFAIGSNTFQNLVEGVVITNTGSGSGILVGNTFNGNGNLSNRAFALNNTNAAVLNLKVQNNTVQNHLGEDLDSDGLLDPGEDVNPTNGVLDPGTAFEIIASGGSTINATGSFAISNNVATGNGTGLVLTAQAGSTINASVVNNTFNNNSDPNTGARITSDAATLNLFSFANNQAIDNGGNGVLITTLNAGVINSVLSEDVNNNGFLDAGEDTNANGNLDLGFTGNTITGNGANGVAVVANSGAINNLNIGAVDNFLPDNTIIGTLAQPDNVITGNGVGPDGGSGILLNTLAGGTISGSIVNNNLESNLQDGIEIDANTGSITLTSIQNNNVINNAVSGISLSGNAAPSATTVNLGTVANNDFDRETAGVNGIFFDITGADVTAVVSNSSFVTVPPLNPNGSFGIGGTVTDGFLRLTVGGATPALGNLFDFNANAAIGVTLAGTSTGSFVNIQQNTIRRTAAGADLTFLGEGIHIRTTDNALLNGVSVIDRNIIGDADNAAFGNASHGIAFNAALNSTVANLTIGNSDGDNDSGNVISRNGADGINFTRTGSADVDLVNIEDNAINFNTDDGINLSMRNAQLVADPGDFTIIDNEITNNGNDGIDLNVQADAGLQVDITNNIITNNGAAGISTTENVNTATDLRNVSGTWSGNTISNNVTNGIFFDGATSGLIVGQAGAGNGNTISDNGLAGILFTAPGTATIENNLISGNGAALGNIRVGAGIDLEGRGFKNITLTDNIIRDNFGDGLEFNNNSNGGAFSFTLTGTGNTIRDNQGRGVDILNQGFDASQGNLVDTTITLNNNTIVANDLEGVYVVNTSSTTQTQDVDSTVALLADGIVNAIPRLTLNMDNNDIIGNGNGTGYSATGLAIRVGTSDGGLADFTDTGGFANGGRGGVVASITNNTLGGNFGDDVLFESFVSTGDPATTAGTWDAATFTVTTFESDPLARLDLTYTGNTVDSTDANNFGAFYNNAEDVFKSRENGQTDPGPFTTGDRRRNAQRQGDRQADTLIPITPGGASDTFLYSGVGPSTFRISVGSDVAPFILDTAPYNDTTDANGIGFAGAVFGELPFGWGQF